MAEKSDEKTSVAVAPDLVGRVEVASRLIGKSLETLVKDALERELKRLESEMVRHQIAEQEVNRYLLQKEREIPARGGKT